MSADEPVRPPAPPPSPPTRPRGRVPPGGWRFVLLEFAVIVAGVLAALAAEAWWDARQEQGRERDYLRQMLADTRENEARLDIAILADSAFVAAAVHVARVLEGLEPAPAADTLANWLIDTFSSTDIQLLTGSYGSIIAAGDLRLIGTDTLRSEIVAYAATLQHVQQMLSLLLDQALGTSKDMGREFPYLRRLLLAMEDTTLLQDPERSIELQPGDQEAIATLFNWQVAGINRVRQLRIMRARTIELRQMLEAELHVANDSSSIGEQ